MKSNGLKSGLPRSVEAVVAVAALIAAAPFFLVCATVLAFTSEEPVLFRQRRVGRKGRIFTLYKFCTMRKAPDGARVTAKDDTRITRWGKVLRRTKLDELPEFWNVLKGEMSLVGPRPEVPCYVDLSNEQWQLVLEARPGLTDPVTISLRNEEGLLAGVDGERERFYLETLQPFKLQGYLEYLSQRSWRADLRILWLTCLIVIFPGRVKDEFLPKTAMMRVGDQAPTDRAAF